MFIDKAKILIRSGKGGDGGISFHREKYVAAGGPDGGDGGHGGDVIIVSDPTLSTLFDFRYKRKYIASDGAPGFKQNCTGKSAENLEIRVPTGTIIRNAETNEMLADMTNLARYTILKGGKGGFGNARFKSSTRQIPTFAKQGTPGVELEVILELKLLADVGIIGFPNVGKSTLVSCVSRAKPKIANYHFTTLTPTLGVVSVGDEYSFVMADIPGLIEGASEGLGLGHAFLKHVERCRLLIHLVDVSGSEGRDPIEDFEKINQELLNFNPDLAKCEQLIAASKCDLASEEQIARFEDFISSKGHRLYKIIAPSATGTADLIESAAAKLVSLPPIKSFNLSDEPPLPIAYTPDQSFTITKDSSGAFVVEGEWLMRLLDEINPTDYGSLQYFHSVMKKSGIISALLKKGASEGSTVKIYDMEFDYVD